MNNFLLQIGGRKFAFAILAITIAALFTAFNKITVQEWMSFTMVIGGIYVVGNVATTYVQKKHPITTKAQPLVIDRQEPIDFTNGADQDPLLPELGNSEEVDKLKT